jgi:ABC-type Co2+ transport system permease subunit
MDYGLDVMEVLRRAAKYLVEGGAVALAAYLVPKSKLALSEIVMLAVTAAAMFAILDLYSPSVGASVKAGSGLALGGGLVGGFPVAR